MGSGKKWGSCKAQYREQRDSWYKRTVSTFSSVLNSKLSFIVDDYNVSGGDDDDGNSGDDNLPN